MRRPHFHAMTAILALVAACSTSPQTRPTTADQRVIKSDELTASRYNNVYEMIEATRPQWLRPRGRTSFNTRESVKVYLDGSLLGEPEQLRGITARSIAEIRWLDANEATLRWGLDHGHGAIVLSTRRDLKP
jgi:hypothetical protein